jgi:hypothetical protein
VTGSRLLVGLASVFAGITAVMLVLASAYRTPVPLAVAAPFAVTGYLMWYQGTGRLEGRMRERARREDARRTANAGSRGTRSRGTRERARSGSRRRSPEPSGPSRREAYRILDLDPGADEGRVKRAYREKVKTAHPDRGGDETEFKRVKNAYERLVD